MIPTCKDGRKPACNHVCQICVSVSQDLLALVPPTGSQPSIRTAAFLSKLKETIKEKENAIIKLQTTEQHLLEIVEMQKEDLTKLTKKISDESNLLETIETKKTELIELKKKLSNDPGFHTFEYVEKRSSKSSSHQSSTRLKRNATRLTPLPFLRRVQSSSKKQTTSKARRKMFAKKKKKASLEISSH